MPCDCLVIIVIVIVICIASFSNLNFTVIINPFSINYLRLLDHYPFSRLEGLPQLINQPLLLILLSQQPLLRLILLIIAIRLHLLLIVVLFLFVLAIDGNEYLYLISLRDDFLDVELCCGIVVWVSYVSVITDVILIVLIVYICDNFFIRVIGYSG